MRRRCLSLLTLLSTMTRLSTITRLRLLSTITRLCRLRLVVHRVAHRALYLLIGCLVRGNLLIHRLVLLLLLLLQYLPPNLTRTTARGAQRREKRYRRAD